MQSANLESNKEVNDNGIFQAALGTAIGAGAVAAAVFGGKGAIKKVKGMAKPGADKASRTVNNHATKGVIDNIKATGSGIKGNIKDGINSVKNGDSVKDAIHNTLSGAKNTVKSEMAGTKDLLKESAEWSGIKKNNMNYEVPMEAPMQNGGVAYQQSMFNPNAQTRASKKEMARKGRQEAFEASQQAKVAPPQPNLDGQQSMFAAIDYLDAEANTPAKPKSGRPKGSKNKPKEPEQLSFF